MANNNQRVQFAKGLSSQYWVNGKDSYNEDFLGYVYFASDTNEIYVDGEVYGIGGTLVETLMGNDYVSSVTLTEDDDHKQTLNVKHYDKTLSKFVETSTPLVVVGIEGKGAVEVVRKKDGENDTQNFEISLNISDAEDNILTEEGGALKAVIDLNGKVGIGYDSASSSIQLTDGNKNVLSTLALSEFEAQLTKDSFVESGEVITLEAENGLGKDDTDLDAGVYLKLVLKLADGNKKDIYINADSLVDQYKAGNGLLLEGDTFSVKLASNSNLTQSADGLAVDLDSVKEAVADEVKDSITASDVKIDDSEDAQSLKDVIDGVKGEIATIDSSVNTLEDAVEEIQGWDATDINVGNDVDKDITKDKSIADAIATLSERISNLEPDENNYDNSTISGMLNNLVAAAGVKSTGAFDAAAYDGTLAAGVTEEDAKPKSIADIIKIEDASLRALIGTKADSDDLQSVSDKVDEITEKLDEVNSLVYRVNEKSAEYNESNGSMDITLYDADITLNPDLTGTLASSSTVHQALETISQSITWQYFEGSQNQEDNDGSDA